MRRFVKLLGLLAALAIPLSARADSVTFAYDSRPVAAGAAIDSGVLRTGNATSISCSAINAGAASRNLTVTFYADDGTTAVYTSSAIAVGAGLTVVATIAGDGGTSGGVTGISVVPARRMRVQLASGGAANGQIVCWGR